ncbi:hypothetical protein HYW75_00490 [Candidatus Pacearchaeota archaeon]|nr:hypothetical protein [Candidatus Pacearchaeota archaeon]
MGIENILKILNKPIYIKFKVVGPCLIGALGIASLATIGDVKVTDYRVNEIYNEFGGTNNTFTTYEKVDFIRSQPEYKSTNKYVKFLDRVKSSN